MDNYSLLFAMHHEHKQRTGHDVTEVSEWAQMQLSANCEVCMALRRLWREVELEAQQPEDVETDNP